MSIFQSVYSGEQILENCSPESEINHPPLIKTTIGELVKHDYKLSVYHRTNIQRQQPYPPKIFFSKGNSRLNIRINGVKKLLDEKSLWRLLNQAMTLSKEPVSSKVIFKTENPINAYTNTDGDSFGPECDLALEKLQPEFIKNLAYNRNLSILESVGEDVALEYFNAIRHTRIKDFTPELTEIDFDWSNIINLDSMRNRVSWDMAPELLEKIAYLKA